MPVSLTVASYNIHKAVGSDGRCAPERILDVLDEIGADVALLQEADTRLGDPAGGQVQVKAPAGRYRITARLARPWAPDQPVKTVEIDLVVR